MSAHSYPVRVDATLDDRLSRWLWLVKWLLAIPHYLVLLLLWAAFMVLSLCALVAILFTGRYPRGIFDFNVGVLRWSWRVAFYTYSGLGTDRYPPFSLEEKPDYPAHLAIDYPEHLSRGLVLVKWWLLAIPHYLVIGVFLGTGWYLSANQSDDWPAFAGTGGLIGLLVLIAAVVLLFTGRYPHSIFDLVLGLNRWVLRVAGYAALMTDDYPPFRLDLGGADPGTGILAMSDQKPLAEPSGPVSSAPPTHPQPEPTRWGAGRVLALVLGSILALTSLGLLTGGGALLVVDGVARDDDGYLMSSSKTLTSPGYAVVSESVELAQGTGVTIPPERWLGSLKVEVTAPSATTTFVGVARSRDVTAYLAGVAHSTVIDPNTEGRTTYSFAPGDAPSVPPTSKNIWVASRQGTGLQTITWSPDVGDWTLVVMNAEGTSPVVADVAVGATAPILDNVAIGLLVAGAVLLLVSGAILVAAVRRRPAA